MKHLTSQEKDSRLGEWHALRAVSVDHSVPGTPDPEIYGLVDRLNEIEGVCVIQSCSGHKSSERKAEGRTFKRAILWLRVEERLLRAFEGLASRLYSSPLVDEVCVRYGREVGPVIEVIFDGKESGRLGRSRRHLISFFNELAGADAPASRYGT